jgi:hypothetical protein
MLVEMEFLAKAIVEALVIVLQIRLLAVAVVLEL